MSGARIFGVILAILGVVMSVFPDGFGSVSVDLPNDVFQVIERRVRGGMVLGVGLCFISVTGLRPFSTSIPTAIFYFMTGALLARLLGLIVDGIVPKQWLMVAVECIAMALSALWLWHSSKLVS